MVELKNVRIHKQGKYMHYISIPKALVDNNVLLMSRRYKVLITEEDIKEEVSVEELGEEELEVEEIDEE